MKSKTGDFHKNKFSVEILKSHIEDIPIKNLDNSWIQENKIDLNSLMADNYSGDDSKVPTGYLNNKYDCILL
ncbi:hypothetical protein [uncultured Methanolobus sp.]|uniref:hypothetical protein n=1 Tax=uncultured Methanolobus sp. TaxID=218300 RepID=UPI002AAB5F88|nr:hypothetical protein [uncultured Methanolobus sp.]